ncbi:MAG: YIP1 family protein [Turicibacter sp.]|nr:YIP1 family protein [Turicibacter sp.]
MRREFKHKALFTLITIFACILSIGGVKEVSANTPYTTYTVNGYGEYIETQTAYLPVRSIRLIDELSFSNASDMQITEDHTMYIADTGNKRIIVSNLEGNLIRVIGEGILGTPAGIFVTEDHTLYVADEGNERVYVFSKTGELLTEYSKPDHPLFGESATFKPQKVAVDKRGSIYIISKGNSNGIIQLSQANNGEFLGYFGVNDARIDLMGMFRDFIFTDEQKAQLKSTAPVTTNNLTIDAKGLIYTITQGEGLKTLKKLNMAGTDMLGGAPYDDYPGDVIVGPIGNIFVTSTNGYIYEYTSEGQLLFVFGGRDNGDQRVGLFKTVSSISMDQNQWLYVLDQEKNEIQIFEPTEFANLVHHALVLYEEGHYLESKQPWLEVIEMNSLFDFAKVGLGEALFKEEAYDEAQTAFKQGLDLTGYSDSYWEIRNVWLKSNLVNIFLLGLAIVVAWNGVKYLDKKKQVLKPVKQGLNKIKNIKLIKELNFIWYFIKHPADGYYGIKREGKVSLLSTTIIFILFIAVFLFNKYQSGFLFKMVKEGQFTIGQDVMILLAMFVLILASHYLVATITDGEGKFKHLYSGVVYSLVPYFLLVPAATILSNVLTLNESFILSFMYTLSYGWIGVLIIIMIKEIHNFTMSEVFKNIFVTIFTALIAVLAIFVVYVLFSQVYDFVLAIIGEVVYRLENFM